MTFCPWISIDVHGDICGFWLYFPYIWFISVESVSEKYCGIYRIDRIENVDKYESASCLYDIDKVQIFLFYILYKVCIWWLLYNFSNKGCTQTYIICLKTMFKNSAEKKLPLFSILRLRAYSLCCLFLMLFLVSCCSERL